MSRGFIKEGNQEEIPILSPRAYLPDGVTNYVTQVGINELLDEKQMLVSEIENLDVTNDNERRITLNALGGMRVSVFGGFRLQAIFGTFPLLSQRFFENNFD